LASLGIMRESSLRQTKVTSSAAPQTHNNKHPPCADVSSPSRLPSWPTYAHSQLRYEHHKHTFASSVKCGSCVYLLLSALLFGLELRDSCQKADAGPQLNKMLTIPNFIAIVSYHRKIFLSKYNRSQCAVFYQLVYFSNCNISPK